MTNTSTYCIWRCSFLYGNATSSRYTYDALHRLSRLQSEDANGTLMQDIVYAFDDASNVTGIANNAGVVNTLEGSYSNTYKYDILHRLVASCGVGDIGRYDTWFTYTPSGRLARKFRDCASVSFTSTVDMAYGYCDKYQPHAVRRMYDHNTHRHFDLRWDPAGNLGQVSATGKDALFETGRFLFWTEDSRMHAAADDRYYSYYAYDHGGERRLKLSGDNKTMDVNAEYMATYAFLDNPTLYPSAYLVLTLHGYTNVAKVECRASLFALPRRSNVTVRKHYYAGAERVAARLGGGGLDALCHVIGIDDDIQKKANVLFDQSLEQVNIRILQDNDLDCVMECKFAIEEFGHKIDGIPRHLQAKVEVADGGKLRAMVDDWSQDHNGGQEDDVYFYHSDHLGSASWITERHGDAVQHLQYLPYGEPYINQRLSGYNERFTFTGKELDEETGYGYFGARYMDHELMTMWLSVDPMADKYPGISPYSYCAWNPVKLVDPDGRDIWNLNKDGELIWKETSEADQIYANGAYVDLPEGIMERGKSYLKDQGHFFLNFENNGNNAIAVFEFMADNADVEFSLLGIASNSSSADADSYFLTTSFEEMGDSYGSEYAYKASKQNKMRSHTHNHPGDNANIVPSTILNNGSILISMAGIGRGDDMGFSTLIREGSPSCSFSIYGKSRAGGHYRPYALTDKIPDYRYQPSKVSKTNGHYIFKAQ